MNNELKVVSDTIPCGAFQPEFAVDLLAFTAPDDACVRRLFVRLYIHCRVG